MNQRSALMMWNAVIAIAMITMVSLFLFDRFAPKPSFAISGGEQAKREGVARKQFYDLQESIQKSRAIADAKLWKEDAELIGPTALANATSIAKRQRVTIAAFRPQKPVTEGPLTRLAYNISVEGTYLQVLNFVKELEQPKHRLVVNVIQLASADGASSDVTATIGIWALKEAETITTGPKVKKSA